MNVQITEQQISTLIALLAKIADRPYTITGSADWPILAFMLLLFSGLITWVWRDLKAAISGNKIDQQEAIRTLKAENDKDHDNIWEAMRRCQDNCCKSDKKPS